MKSRLIVFVCAGAVALGTVNLAFKAAQKETSLERVNRIYARLLIGTGLSQLVPPIVVDSSQVFNAMNTGDALVIFQGLIDQMKNDDELALVIGHEMAHSTLMHMGASGLNPENDTAQQNILEAQADKMGAFYIMRAGYSICKAREFMKTMNFVMHGDFPGNGDHPPNAYRYDQLNINCN